jgi:hypothetical protein
MKRTIISMTLLCGLSVLSACWGDWSGSTSTSGRPRLPTAVVKLSLPAPGADVYSIVATITLAPDVTVKDNESPPRVNSREIWVAKADGGATNALVDAIYTAATESTPGTVRIGIIDSDSITPDEACNVNVYNFTGAALAAGEFSVTELTATDQYGAVISSITPSYVVVTLE